MKAIKLRQLSHRAAIGRWSAILLGGVGIQVLVLPPVWGTTTEPAPQTGLPQAKEPSAAKEITDKGITSAVEEELKSEKGVMPNDVDVSTSQGIVTLTGSGENILTKERGVKIAESIRGVRGVIDRIAVTPVTRPDTDILKDAQAALLQDPATKSYHVEVAVQDAVATLTGKVGSYAEKQLAARIAKGVKGMKEVRNETTINYLGKRTDPEIAADIKARLQWDVWTNGSLINTTVTDSYVTMTGAIGSELTLLRAIDDAWVNGVTAVNSSGMKIEPLANEQAHQELKYAIRSDDEIKQAIVAALHLDPRTSAFSFDVTVEGGVVILSGSVGNLIAKNSAEMDAKDIVSVWRVDNQLKIRPAQPSSNPEMQKELKAALLWDPVLDSSTIDVAVNNRIAYLSGAVDLSSQKAEAQDVASRIDGVVMVRNHLKVEPEFSIVTYGWPFYSYYGWPYQNQGSYVTETFGPQPYPSDEEIKKKITDAFFWSPFVHFDDVKVTVNGGVATLTGTVGTRIGWGEAEKDAKKSGATAVLNKIQVQKGAWF